MKIIDVAEFYAEQGGGVKTYVDQKLRAASQAGHELVVIAPGPRTESEPRHGGRIEWIRSSPMPIDPRYYLLLNERAVHDILKKSQPDIIEGSSPWTGGWMVARYPEPAKKSFIFHQDPVAVYPHTLLGRHLGYDRVDKLFGLYFRYLRRLAGHFDVTVTSGQWLADRLIGHGIDNAEAVPFGVDRAVFEQARPDPELRRQLLARCGAPPEGDLLVTVSRHHPEKRLLSLLKGFSIAAQRRPLGLVVFGDGPLRPLVERAAKRIPGVYIAGYSRDRAALAATLASADALLHGSGAETFGIVLAEALCAGLPLVAPNRGGATELAGPEYATLFEPGDPEDCAVAIERLLCQERAALQSAAKHAAATRLIDVAQHFQALFELYEKLG